jgi:hypothetical protein
VGSKNEQHRTKERMMSGYQAHNFEIPQETIEVAQAAFPKGNVYLILL